MALAVGGAADAAESVLLLDLADGHGRPGWLVAATTAKWVGLVVAVLAGVVAARQSGDTPRGPDDPTPYDEDDVHRPAGPVRRVLPALYTHRFSLLVVVPFAALGLAKGTDVLDQLPDVQRQWVDSGAGSRIAVSAFLTAVVALVVVVVGRLRSHYVAMRVLGDTTPPHAAPYRAPSLLPWFVTAGVIGAGVLVSRLLLGGWDVIWPRVGIALVVPLVVAAGSLLLRRGGAPPPWSPYRRPVTPEQAATTRVVGDVLGLLVLVIPGLGLVRAFAAPVFLGTLGWDLALLVGGFVGALVTWPAGRWVGDRVAGGPPSGP